MSDNGSPRPDTPIDPAAAGPDSAATSDASVAINGERQLDPQGGDGAAAAQRAAQHAEHTSVGRGGSGGEGDAPNQP